MHGCPQVRWDGRNQFGGHVSSTCVDSTATRPRKQQIFDSQDRLAAWRGRRLVAFPPRGDCVTLTGAAGLTSNCLLLPISNTESLGMRSLLALTMGFVLAHV